MEDPEITQLKARIKNLEDTLSSTTTNDFRNHTRLGIISSKGSDNKDVVLFSEKINQKYQVLHRPRNWVGSKFGVDKPSIWIAEGNSLSNFENHTLLMKPEQDWEELKIGSGPPPIKTRYGWLLIYHGVDKDLVYRAGAAILDLDNPVKVLARTKEPILQPEEPYERFGNVNNVVFPTGACVIDERLHVYYGGADKVCCPAVVELNALLHYILNGG